MAGLMRFQGEFGWWRTLTMEVLKQNSGLGSAEFYLGTRTSILPSREKERST
jgi:hypothetical protein